MILQHVHGKCDVSLYAYCMEEMLWSQVGLCLKKLTKCDRCKTDPTPHDKFASVEKCVDVLLALAPRELSFSIPPPSPMFHYASNAITLMKNGKSRCYVCSVECTILRCGLCRLVIYCDPKCQAKDWVQHKKICNGKKEKAKK